MKCLLIFPSWVVTDGFVSSYAEFQAHYWQPTGIMYVAAAARKAGHEVKLLDGAFITHADILKEVKNFNPGFVGIYGNTPLWHNTVKTINDIKKINKDIFVSVGGPYPIGSKKRVFENLDNLDGSFTGEGDIAVPNALDKLQKGESLKGVAGLIYKHRNKDGSFKLIDNGPAPLIEDLDSLPFPARDLVFPLKKYMPAVGTYRRSPVGSIISSRGCNNRCLYCFQVSGQQKIRYRSPANVMKEAEDLVINHGAKEIRFLDDNFAGDYKWVEEMCKLIKESKLGFSWYVSARADGIDYPLAKKMKAAGCWGMLIGVESGVQKNLDTLNKNETLDQIRIGVKGAKKAGIKVYTPYIFGIPGETYEEGLQTVDFAIELDPHYVNFHTLAPFPGSDLFENIEKYGKIIGDQSECNFEMAGFIPYTMSREEIFKLREVAFRRFYKRPKFILRRILTARTKNDFKTLYVGGKSFLNLLFKKESFVHKGTHGYHMETKEIPFT
jgi:anaerobic magnesium-protoporphyrin IX monomethyl ester cyclase